MRFLVNEQENFFFFTVQRGYVLDFYKINDVISGISSPTQWVEPCGCYNINSVSFSHFSLIGFCFNQIVVELAWLMWKFHTTRAIRFTNCRLARTLPQLTQSYLCWTKTQTYFLSLMVLPLNWVHLFKYQLLKQSSMWAEIVSLHLSHKIYI